MDAEGDVWDLFMDEGSFLRAEDGPRKVSIIVEALERFPALAAFRSGLGRDCTSIRAGERPLTVRCANFVVWVMESPAFGLRNQ